MMDPTIADGHELCGHEVHYCLVTKRCHDRVHCCDHGVS